MNRFKANLSQHTCFLPIALYFLASFVCPVVLYAADVRVSADLGVETGGTVKDVDADNPTIRRIAGTLFDKYHDNEHRTLLAIETSSDVYVLVPLAATQYARMLNGKHVLRTTDGTEFSGTLSGTLTTVDGREYDLAKVQSLSTVNVPRLPVSKLVRHDYVPFKDSVIWELRFPGSEDLFYSVTNPRFEYKYYGMRGELDEMVKRTQSFNFKIGTDDKKGNIPDFMRLTLTKSSESDGASLTALLDFLERRPYIDHGVTHPSAKNVN